MTVRQLRHLIDYDELRGWALFEEKYGPLHAPLRIEGAIARAIAPFLQDAKPADLMLWPKEEEKVATAEDIFKLLVSVKKSAPKKVETDGQ
jgi:hypothetical protein